MPLKCAPWAACGAEGRLTHCMSLLKGNIQNGRIQREREREHCILVARESNCSMGDAEKLESNNGCKTVTTRSLTELCLLDRLFND